MKRRRIPVSKMPSDGARHNGEKRTSIERSPYTDREPSAGCRHPEHFPQRFRFIRKELKPMLAQNDVILGCTARNARSVAMAPFDGCQTFTFSEAFGSAKHAFVCIKPGDNSVRTCQARGSSGDYPRTAGDVEHSVPRSNSRSFDERSCPFLHPRRNYVSLIGFRGGKIDRPS